MTIELWSVDLDEVAERADLLEVVSSTDRAAGARLRTATLRRRFVARRAVTRHLLGRKLALPPEEIQFARRCRRCGSVQHGRPEIVGASEKFSVSACGSRAMVAIAGEQIGVDIEVCDVERFSRTAVPLAMLAAKERLLLESLPAHERARAFLQMWVAKEAVLKADGRGLCVHPRVVDTSAIVTSGVGYVRLDGTVWTVRSVTSDRSVTEDVPGAVATSAAAGQAQATSVRPIVISF